MAPVSQSNLRFGGADRAKVRAFTLIELLTVIAITGVLLTIIVLPIFQTFNLVRTAQSYSDAQEKARKLMDRITREIQGSVGVRDNTGLKGTLDLLVPTGPGSVDATIKVPIPYLKLDIIKPAEGTPEVDPLGNPIYRNPSSQHIDPTLSSPKGQPVLPVAPGATIVRYFVGLRDPFYKAAVQNGPGIYDNPYDGLLMKQNGDRDNLYVLYRAEVPFNATYFAQDKNGTLIIDDPDFFIPDGTQVKAAIIQAWQSKAVIQTEVSRYDLVQPVYNKATRAVTYDQVGSDLAPRLVPLIQFRPNRVSDEPADQQRVIRLGEESDIAQVGPNGITTTLGPDVLRTKFGAWSNAVVRIYESNGPATIVGHDGARSDGSTGFSVYGFATAPVGDDTTGGTELFDEAAYEGSVSAITPYPFSAAITAANDRSNWLSNPILIQNFVPFFHDTAAGQITASFNIAEVGVGPLPFGATANLPTVQVGTNASAIQSNGAGAAYSGDDYMINDCFNRVYNEHPYLQSNVQRFIDLRVTKNADHTYGPLFPAGITASGNVVVQGNTSGFPRAQIVPGSEIVTGPDELPGPNQGNEIRYTRSTGNPGPNQYKINYTALPQPADYHVLGLTDADLNGFNPAVYDPTNLVSAVFQARYMPGYIQLNSDPAVPIPAGQNPIPIRVSYRFQFTQSTDSYAVDYDTRQVMSLLVTVRNYPQSNVPNPQTVTLKANATVRNVLR
jgi:prepilin-type N-terminal cleavage/methylation domain-containing protein